MRNIALIVIVNIAVCMSLGCMNSSRDLLEEIADGNHASVQKLLDDGVSVDGVGFDGWTPITFAASKQDFETVKMLLDHGAKVGVYDGGGNTALFWATYTDSLDIAKLLLKFDADPCRFNGKGKSAMQIAVEMNRDIFIALYGNCER